MNALDAIELSPGFLSSPPQDGIGLAARVASAHVRRAMADSPGQQVLFMIAVPGKALTCAITCALDRDLPGATVAVHEDLATDMLPPRMVSRRSLASYRNDPRGPGGGAIAYAPSPRELDDVGKTSAEIQHVSEQVLMAEPELWLDCTQELAGLNPRERQNVANVLRGIAAADVATGLEMFGAFIERLDRAHASEPIERAMDRALPALRIPHGACRFKKAAAHGKLPSVEAWAERFRELQGLADDALGLRREGAPLNRALLTQRLQHLAAEGEVTEDEQETLAALLADRRIEPGQWRPAQAAASELPWAVVERLVKPSKRTAQQPLGDATLALFRGKMPDELGPEDSAVLAAMAPDTHGTADGADDEERGFFFRQRTSIADCSKPLLKRWEQHVFRKTEQHSDLALGLFIAIADLVAGTEAPSCPLVYVRLQGAERSKFWETRNPELCRFMRDRYRGLPEVFKDAGVEMDWGMCWTGNWDAPGGAARGSRLAREFKFDIFLLNAEGAPAEDGRKAWLADAARLAQGTTQLIWTMPADSLASSYSENMEEVANFQGARALLASGRFSRAQDQDRSTDGRLSLERRASFGDAHGRPDGILVDPNDGRSRAGCAFEQGLAGLRGGVLPEPDACAIEAAYQAFASSYSDAVRAMVRADGAGLDDPALLQQSVAYGELLALLRRHARKDDCRRALWQPMLSVGIAFSDDRPPVAICTPWHPFKLAAAAAKARQLAGACARVLGGAAADVRTFSRTVARTVGDGWHPAVALSPATPKPYLLSETDHYADFGLMEAPTADQGAADAFDGYSEQAGRELLGVADEYLEIQPHERANFSVVLYNADNRGLPSHLASALAAKVEQEKDLRCDLVLTHSDQRRLRQIYAEQNVAISARLDGAMASEAAQTFLSRLRVGFIDLGGLGKAGQSVQAADLVFLHDVIARGAKTAWRRVPEPPDGWLPFEHGAPDGETRRRPFEHGARKTEALLVPAERPLEVQHYLDLVRDFHGDHRDAADGHYVPVREIDFDESGVGAILDQAHRVARWVVTYDAIADPHLFRSNGIDIIRYVPRPDRDHSLIVSTRQPGAMLLAKLSEEIGRVLSAGGQEAEALARLCIGNASAISGRVVLRAARLENNALELLGLVLSRQVVSDSLAPGVVPVCWLLLDDFADRLGHKGRKADILVICLSVSDGVPAVDLVVVESKFTGQDGESAAMAASMEQLRATTGDLRDRIIGTDDALNRPTWLRRLADLLLEHGVFPGNVGGRDPGEWARVIRSDEAALRIAGLSLVFVHDRLDGVPDPTVSRGGPARMLRITLPPPATAATLGQRDGVSALLPPPPVAPPAVLPPAPSGVVLAEPPPAPPNTPPSIPPEGGLPPGVRAFVLDRVRSGVEHEAAEWLQDTRTRLRQALRGYGLDAEIVGDRLTPNAALVRFKGTDKMTVAEVEKRRGVLLTSHGLDVIGVRPEKGEVVVMAARENRAILDLCESWRRRTFPATSPGHNTSFVVGERENDGRLLYLNLGAPFGGQPMHGPHTLIAGETGGGKGVLTRNLILDICATNAPDSARIRMIDPKGGGDYPWLDALPHIDGGLVSTQAEAMEVLRGLVATMEERYARITPLAPNIDRYNAKVPPGQRLPRIYLFHDELGDWMADKDHAEYRAAVESYVVRLASKARAAGIRLFLVMQRPDKDALPGQVKANMNNKICLRVSSQTNSRIVLDEGGAEVLLGNGHFAAKLANEKPSNQSSLIFGQAPFMDDDEARGLAHAIAAHWG